jgi:hypothetical protein
VKALLPLAQALAPAPTQSCRVPLEVTPRPMSEFTFELTIKAGDGGRFGAALPDGGDLQIERLSGGAAGRSGTHRPEHPWCGCREPLGHRSSVPSVLGYRSEVLAIV